MRSTVQSFVTVIDIMGGGQPLLPDRYIALKSDPEVVRPRLLLEQPRVVDGLRNTLPDSETLC
jgi:hypothetical protein